MGKKKPTMNEMKNVVTNLIMQVNKMDEHLFRLDSAVFNYVSFKGDADKYKEWLEKQQEENKNDKPVSKGRSKGDKQVGKKDSKDNS